VGVFVRIRPSGIRKDALGAVAESGQRGDEHRLGLVRSRARGLRHNGGSSGYGQCPFTHKPQDTLATWRSSAVSTALQPRSSACGATLAIDR